MTARRTRGDAVDRTAQGIDRMLRNVQTGRFERSLSTLTAAGALMTAAEIYFEHDSASFGNKMMWLPVGPAAGGRHRHRGLRILGQLVRPPAALPRGRARLAVREPPRREGQRGHGAAGTARNRSAANSAHPGVASWRG